MSQWWAQSDLGYPLEKLAEIRQAWDAMMEHASRCVVACGWRPDQCTWAYSSGGRASLFVDVKPVRVGERLEGVEVFCIETRADLDPDHPTLMVEGRWLREVPAP